MSQALLSRYERINDRCRGAIGELAKIERLASKLRAKLIRVVGEMHKLFKSKPVEVKLGNYAGFDEWVEDVIKPLVGVEKRTVYYWIKINDHLIGKVTDEELEEMGSENAKALAKFAEQKGKVTKELVERAIAAPTKVFEEEIRQLVPGQYQYQGGRWVTIEIRGPEEHCTWLRNFLQLVRRQEGHGPSDADLLRDVLDNVRAEIVAGETLRRLKIAGSHPIVVERRLLLCLRHFLLRVLSPEPDQSTYKCVLIREIEQVIGLSEEKIVELTKALEAEGNEVQADDGKAAGTA